MMYAGKVTLIGCATLGIIACLILALETGAPHFWAGAGGYLMLVAGIIRI